MILCGPKQAHQINAAFQRYLDKYYAPGVTEQKRRRMLALVWQKATKPLPLP